MGRFQFSLRAVLGLVLSVAVACAALLNATELVATAVFNVTLLVLFAAIVRGLFCPDPGRVFWLGFAVFGWGYLLVVHWHPETTLVMQYGLYESPLATSQLLGFVYVALWPDALDRTALCWHPDPEDFMTVGHSLLALAFGLLGGLLARYFYEAGRESEVGVPGSAGT